MSEPTSPDHDDVPGAPGVEPAPSGPAHHDSSAEEVFRTSLRTVLWLLGALLVVGVGVGWLVAGAPGVWGALIGVGLALVFSGTTIVAMLRTAHSSAQTMAAVVMGTWLAKVLVVIVVLAVLRDQDFYSRGVLAVVLLAGVLGSAYLDYRAVSRARIPYVDPASSGTTTPDS
ncbi:hypothetical protein [Cellulomonas uda]|uniref:ATP synthase protein I n=1 Tax=Cellulomonas uda TaxID=1714 RepID=A0A4Y3KDB4_CELUD|nr:hypothetical protein [Cellulomonas uda]NII67293.1 hypothetical protein [Cellulomonas uda]GEA81676.1 hypothetical protein CUD01_21200 [Cellulomonas uda]